MRVGLRRLVQWIGELGSDPDDDADLRRTKSLLVSTAVLISFLALFWVLLYALFGEWAAAAIPLLYITLSVTSVAVFHRTRRYRLFRTSQLALMLLLPFALHLVLGGFVLSSGVLLWSVLSPFGALVFGDARQARRWFLSFVGVVVACGFLQTFTRTSNNLPRSLGIAFFVLNIAAVSLVSFVLLAAFSAQLSAERHKAEGLLLNILPARIAARLKEHPEHVIAERFESASVLFADVVGFTPLSAEMTPDDLVDVLNEVFSHFDRLADKHGVEKIKTVGDAYMVASGVPNHRADHAAAVARMALDMRSFVSTHPSFDQTPLRFRIGINSGPLVAGVIGQRKFIYDLWGDSVNIASRMESHGEPDRIQLTQTTYELLRDEFVCEPRGVVDVKGKGPMPTWYLLGPRPGPQGATSSP